LQLTQYAAGYKDNWYADPTAIDSVDFALSLGEKKYFLAERIAKSGAAASKYAGKIVKIVGAVDGIVDLYECMNKCRK